MIMRRYEVEIHYINLNKIGGFIYTTYNIPNNDDKAESEAIGRALGVSDASYKRITFIRLKEIPC